MTIDRSSGPQLDPGSVTPLYEQVANWVQAEVEAGRLKPGAKFADSRDLAEEWGIAYQTVRRAMRELRERGLVESRVGKGTFVAARPPASLRSL
jgi:DNA-binding GntR family transcriptional regulator